MKERRKKKMSEGKRENPFALALKDILAGSAGGIAQCLSGHPLDTVKVRLQTQPTNVPVLKYQGTIHAFQTIIKEEGLAAVYKGVQSPLIGMALMNSVLFLSYGQAKAFMQRDSNEPLTIPQYFLCGAFVGLSVSFVEGPVDLLKSQLQSQGVGGAKSRYTGFVDCAKQIVTNHGVRGVYQGLQATLIRDIPANALYFGTYEVARRALVKPGQKVEDLSPLMVLLAGGLGGMAFWAFTYPTDVIKSSLQTDSPVRSERKYANYMDAVRKIHKADGIKGFFKGFTPCMIRSFPANAVCFLAYEQARKIIG